ncbi:hypothetical protein BT69DRAFT_245205 [Atractiella rhizophila]|nr:hypothetical protein BT69DRAFT_245205 [Atractiella rhizophila]
MTVQRLPPTPFASLTEGIPLRQGPPLISHSPNPSAFFHVLAFRSGGSVFPFSPSFPATSVLTDMRTRSLAPRLHFATLTPPPLTLHRLSPLHQARNRSEVQRGLNVRSRIAKGEAGGVKGPILSIRCQRGVSHFLHASVRTPSPSVTLLCRSSVPYRPSILTSTSSTSSCIFRPTPARSPWIT